MLAGITCVLFGLASASASAAYRVELDAPDSLRKLLEEFLDLERYKDREDLNADQLNFMAATAPDQVAKLAATEGYFSTKTTVRVDESSGKTTVRLAVDAGPRTRVSDVGLQVSGAASEESPRQVDKLRQGWSLNQGDPFRQQDWDKAKQDGLEILRQRRYAAARIADSEARIHPERHEAELSVEYDSGPAFTLGPVQVSGTQRYPQRIIENVNPLQVGEEFSTERLLEFQRQILRTPYFSNAVVSIDRDPAHSELAPVNVNVTEFPTQRVRGGVGYGTDTGAHVEGRYSHYNIFGRAWVFDAQTRLEQRRQTGSLELAMPPDGSAFVNSAQASIERTTLEGVDLSSRRIGLRRARTTDEYDLAFTLEYFNDRLEQTSGAALPSDTIVLPGVHQALVAGFARTHRQVDNPLFPRSGHISTYQAGIAVKGPLTDETFFRLYWRRQDFRPVGKTDLVILRGELGAVISKGGNAQIPASLLFRAGGTESIRGYSYQSIGNEQNGTVYPTRFLATGSVEYQHWFTASWGGAVFYDLGTATDNWPEKQIFHAVGIGARWRSPVGRINVDLGYGIQRSQIRPHLSLGVAF
ncbi:autotransporter assembly complex protein TamA [Noviherbaspirillum massiliense]|uniref:autotransporter assembly complex protein TamA n=1 Tax=Noviherbaspirillum massiliense TaxID=1465823 RepID=UPI00035CCAC3|nr:autotransporter assembly complex family protein [Noviherbaspirillum massiliense]